MTRARMPRPSEVAAARRDPRLIRAFAEREDDLTWRNRGLCQTVDPEMFFPAPSEPADAALALCRSCDVQGACLAWALEVGDCHGVWGATTPRERRAMLVAWRSAETGGTELPSVDHTSTVCASTVRNGAGLSRATRTGARRTAVTLAGAEHSIAEHSIAEHSIAEHTDAEHTNIKHIGAERTSAELCGVGTGGLVPSAAG